jgi:hypothetical protein
VLQFLEGQQPLAACLPFVEALLAGCSEARRNLSVVRNLRRGEHLQVGGRGAAALGCCCAGLLLPAAAAPAPAACASNAGVAPPPRRAQVREEQVLWQQRAITVTGERACSICHKRIGSSVFVAYPAGSLAHYLCHRRAQPEAPLAGAE